MSDRLRDAFSAILDALLPALATYVKWEYRVVGTSPGPPVTISASPVSAACPFGTLANITLWPGPTGGYAVPAPGSLVLVEFHEGSPAKPSVCGLDPNVPPLMVTLGGPTALPVIPAIWGSTLAVDLTTFAVAMAAAATGPLAPMAAPATALQSAIAALPPGATVKVKAV
jgi:hypothetical protein